MQRPIAEALDVYGYRPLPVEFAVLVVPRVHQQPTPFTDFLFQSNAERRRYPARVADCAAVRMRHVG